MLLTAMFAAAAIAAPMTTGLPVRPPPGYLAMCQREPIECAPSSASADELAEVVNKAKVLFWKSVFTPWAETFGRPAVGLGELEQPDGRAWAAEDFGASLPGPVPVDLDGPKGAVIQTVNREVNRSMRSVPDSAVFGEGDYWTARSSIGDCEDFALAKRRRLIEAGIDPALLSLAIVQTWRGEPHAVLLVRTTKGEVVLDNIHRRILPWTRTDYVWNARQIGSGSLDWVSILSPRPGGER